MGQLEADAQLLSATRRLVRTGEAARVRAQALLSQSDVARLVGVKPATVWRWERGQRQPRGETAIRYGRLLRALAEQDARRVHRARLEREHRGSDG